jgi:hypothetical protein
MIGRIFSGCANPGMSSWWVTDSDNNFLPFPTNRLTIGICKAEVMLLMGTKHRIVESGDGYEVIAFQRWQTSARPDYGIQTLYIRLEDDSVRKWEVIKDTVETMPSSWSSE